MIKRSTKILHWFYKLSWKKMVGIGVFLLVIGGGPLILESALNPTRTRSEAALLPKPEPVSQEFVTPTGPPKIFLVDHFFGKVGDAVLIHGENLGGLHDDSWISLAGKKIGLEDLVSWTADYIEFKVPEGAKSGVVETSILGERTKWEGMFFVTDETTEASLSLKPVGTNQAELLAENIEGGKELLIWFLVISGEGKLNMTGVNGVTAQEREFELPIGRIYEARLTINSQVAAESTIEMASLLKLEKAEEMLVGIARGELSANGVIKPLQVNPLYVSF